MKKVLLLCFISIFSISLFAQGTIDFDDDTKWTMDGTSYSSNHVYTDGVFSATGGPVYLQGTAAQGGVAGAFGIHSCRLKNVTNAEWIITIASGGVGEFGMKIRRWDGSPSPDLNLDYSIDGGTNWTTVSTINNTSLDNKSDWKLFTGTVNDESTNIKIRLVANGKTERIMVDDFYWTAPGSSAVEIPEFSETAGTYTAPVDVTITSATADVAIYYTTDGTVPTDASTLYENPVSISSTTTLKAIAYKAGMTESSVASATYSFPVEVATIAELRGGLTDGTVYILTGEVFLSFQQNYRGQKIVQDATGGILIDDTGAEITTVYNLNDGITGLIGALSEFSGLLQFIPAMDPGAATSNGNVVSATELTISDLKANWSSYESKLVMLSNVSFGAKAGDKFADGQNYTLTDNSANEIVLRTNFRGTDLVDNVIPASATVVGVAAIYDGAHQIVPRGAADISVVTKAVNDMVKQQIAISPNPFQNNIKVEADSKVVSASFYNSVGQLVKEVYNVDSSIPTAELAKGLYIIQVKFEDGSVSTQKVTKK